MAELGSLRGTFSVHVWQQAPQVIVHFFVLVNGLQRPLAFTDSGVTDAFIAPLYHGLRGCGIIRK